MFDRFVLAFNDIGGEEICSIVPSRVPNSTAYERPTEHDKKIKDCARKQGIKGL